MAEAKSFSIVDLFNNPPNDGRTRYVRESDYNALMERYKRLVHAIRYEEFTTAIKLALAEEVDDGTRLVR